jgi:hypothetical protein
VRWANCRSGRTLRMSTTLAAAICVTSKSRMTRDLGSSQRAGAGSSLSILHGKHACVAQGGLGGFLYFLYFLGAAVYSHL